MNARSALSILAILSLVSAAGCDARGGSNGDDDDDDGGGLAGLDTNNDGALTDADLDTGETGLYSTTSDSDSDTEEGETTTSGWLASGDGAWSVNMSTSGTIPMRG